MKKHIKTVIIIGAAIFLCIIGAYAILDVIQSTNDTPYQITGTQHSLNTGIDHSAVQTFKMDNDYLNAIAFSVGRESGMATGLLKCILRQGTTPGSGSIIATSELDILMGISTMPINKMPVVFEFYETLTPGAFYNVEVYPESDDVDANLVINLWGSSTNSYADGKLYMAPWNPFGIPDFDEITGDLFFVADTIDTGADTPTCTVNGPATGQVDTPYTFTAIGSGGTGDYNYCYRDSLFDEWSEWTVADTVSYSWSTSGQYFVYAKCRDENNLESQPCQTTITITDMTKMCYTCSDGTVESIQVGYDENCPSGYSEEYPEDCGDPWPQQCQLTIAVYKTGTSTTIQGANVTIGNTMKTTDTNGIVSFIVDKNTEVTVTVEAMGYQTYSETVSILDQDAFTRIVDLIPEGIINTSILMYIVVIILGIITGISIYLWKWRK